MLKKILTWFGATVLCASLIGCAHPISMAPDVTTVKTSSVQPIGKSVGYHIADADRAREVITAGGGGDKISYFPYRDLELGLYKVLSEVFTDVKKIQDPKDTATIGKTGIALLVTPRITTASSSESLVTWPPTQFTVDLACTITDAQGTPVEVIRVSGYGQATFDEFKSNFSLAATRASNQAMDLLVKALGESTALRQ